MNGSQVQQEIERFTQDALWYGEHRQELLRQYPERWVAVYNKQVVGAAKDLPRLITQLERKGIPPQHVYRDYLTNEEVELIL